ncbi:MAG: threonylcarbamoyl-AMP synthase [Muribaculaceae bacterium]|nr:threonylcarbamoyl-AMP synthase [Muribaculaceae bacterium]
MEYLTIYPTSINERSIDQAVKALRDGQIIIYPTDTLYALGCDALNNRAIEKLCAHKGINPDKQLLSVVCADISQASDYARIDNHSFALLKRALPGAFTFILPASTKLPKVFKGRKTVGVRVPDNPIAQALAAALGNPILSASVSVNPDTPEEAASPESLEMNYENMATLIIDGGEGGTQPSTIINCIDSTAPEIVRQGKGAISL